MTAHLKSTAPRFYRSRNRKALYFMDGLDSRSKQQHFFLVSQELLFVHVQSKQVSGSYPLHSIMLDQLHDWLIALFPSPCSRQYV